MKILAPAMILSAASSTASSSVSDMAVPPPASPADPAGIVMGVTYPNRETPTLMIGIVSQASACERTVTLRQITAYTRWRSMAYQARLAPVGEKRRLFWARSSQATRPSSSSPWPASAPRLTPPATAVARPATASDVVSPMSGLAAQRAARLARPSRRPLARLPGADAAEPSAAGPHSVPPRMKAATRPARPWCSGLADGAVGSRPGPGMDRPREGRTATNIHTTAATASRLAGVALAPAREIDVARPGRARVDVGPNTVPAPPPGCLTARSRWPRERRNVLGAGKALAASGSIALTGGRGVTRRRARCGRRAHDDRAPARARPLLTGARSVSAWPRGWRSRVKDPSRT